MLWHKLPEIHLLPSWLTYRSPWATPAEARNGGDRPLPCSTTAMPMKWSALLKKMNMEVEIFYEVEADPTLSVVRKGAEMANSFKPDVIVALGGGSPSGCRQDHVWVM